jgi:hypothetical protein
MEATSRLDGPDNELIGAERCLVWIHGPAQGLDKGIPLGCRGCLLALELINRKSCLL